MQLPDRPLLLAGFARLQSDHVRQLVGVGIELAGAFADLEPGFNAVGAQILADRVPRKTCAPRDIPDREMLPMAPASDKAAQKAFRSAASLFGGIPGGHRAPEGYALIDKRLPPLILSVLFRSKEKREAH